MIGPSGEESVPVRSAQHTESLHDLMAKSRAHRPPGSRLHAALVVEQTLGHVTYGQNLQAVLAGHPLIDPTFILVPYDMPKWAARVPATRTGPSDRVSAWPVPSVLSGDTAAST